MKNMNKYRQISEATDKTNDEDSLTKSVRKVYYCSNCKNVMEERDRFCDCCGMKNDCYSEGNKAKKETREVVTRKECYCGNCNQKIEEGDSFCSNCGKKIYEKNFVENSVKKIQNSKLYCINEELSEGTWSLNVSRDWFYFRNIKDGRKLRIKNIVGMEENFELTQK